jgi:hypothetical protein
MKRPNARFILAAFAACTLLASLAQQGAAWRVR